MRALWRCAVPAWLFGLVLAMGGAAGAAPCTVEHAGARPVAPLPEGFVARGTSRPTRPGFTRIARFAIQPAERLATATLVLLANDAESIYPGERRRRILMLRFDDGMHLLMRQSYLDGRPDDLWIRDAGERRVQRVALEPALDDLEQGLCGSLASAGLGGRIEIRSLSDGTVPSKSRLARLLDPNRAMHWESDAASEHRESSR